MFYANFIIFVPDPRQKPRGPEFHKENKLSEKKVLVSDL